MWKNIKTVFSQICKKIVQKGELDLNLKETMKMKFYINDFVIFL